MSYSANYYRNLIEGYKALGRDVGPEVWDNLREAEEREAQEEYGDLARQKEFADQEDARLKKLVDEFFLYDDARWPVRNSNYRGSHTMRALAIYTGRTVDEIASELLVVFDEANRGRQKKTAKYSREKTQLLARTEVPNWLVRNWCAMAGLVPLFTKGFGEAGMLLRPDVVPRDALLLLTKDWIAIRGGKIVASWNPLWHDHRAVNGIWVRPQ